MKPLEAALRFMHLFYSGSRDGITELESILSPDLHFQGPLYVCGSAREYIEALLADPPLEMSFRVIRSFESKDAACLIYDFQKRAIQTTMAQYFELRDGLITKIILVFDTSVFAS